MRMLTIAVCPTLARGDNQTQGLRRWSTMTASASPSSARNTAVKFAEVS